jgi:predicted PurR-regulated permease PerM
LDSALAGSRLRLTSQVQVNGIFGGSIVDDSLPLSPIPSNPAATVPQASGLSEELQRAGASALTSTDATGHDGLGRLRGIALSLVIITTSLYLLDRLQLVLRPLLIAILLCYLIVPLYLRLRRRMRPVVSFLLILVGIVIGFQALARMIYADLLEINRNLPRYQGRVHQLSDQVRHVLEPFIPLPAPEVPAPSIPRPPNSSQIRQEPVPPAPPSRVARGNDRFREKETSTELEQSSMSGTQANSESLPPSEPSAASMPLTADSSRTTDSIAEAIEAPATATSAPIVPPPLPPSTAVEETPTWALARRAISQAAGVLGNVLVESLVVAFYMVFLLQEAGRFHSRIRSSFSPARAAEIDEVVASINRAITDYLSVKVRASLIVAVPTAIACWGFGVSGAATWGVLSFFGNFLPYVGGFVATLLPILLAFLEFDTIFWPALFALTVLLISSISSNLIEPAMTGRVLDLSPLVVMLGLAFWSVMWGFVGMCLAVPLTVVLKIILEHTPATRPIARMLGDAHRPV